MSEKRLKLVVRTPREMVVEMQVVSVRVPTETGQVGLRPRVEPLVLAVEPGLVLVRVEDAYQFVGTAGGLLRCDGATASLLTPLAVSGDDEVDVVEALEKALAQPSVEMEAREKLGRLQSSILHELRQGGEAKMRQAEGVR
jgi:F0F1-type ATP synthase epsilon subunit